MGGCGTYAAGRNVPYVYQTVGKINNAKILEGIPGTGKHGLPEESHSPNAKYIKLREDGTFKEMRIYGSDKKNILDISYAHETDIAPRLPNGKKNWNKILHYHEYPDGRFETRGKAKPITPELIEKYKPYLKGVPL